MNYETVAKRAAALLEQVKESALDDTAPEDRTLQFQMMDDWAWTGRYVLVGRADKEAKRVSQSLLVELDTPEGTGFTAWWEDSAAGPSCWESLDDALEAE